MRRSKAALVPESVIDVVAGWERTGLVEAVSFTTASPKQLSSVMKRSWLIK